MSFFKKKKRKMIRQNLRRKPQTRKKLQFEFFETIILA